MVRAGRHFFSREWSFQWKFTLTGANPVFPHVNIPERSIVFTVAAGKVIGTFTAEADAKKS